MPKRKVLIVVHQLNYGGAQISLLNALDAIDYDENEVTLYVRKNRLDLIGRVNKNVSKIIVNDDSSHYYRKPYAAFLIFVSAIKKLFKRDNEATEKKIVDYIVKKQFEYETKHFFNNSETYDIAISYIQDFTAEFVADYINAIKKIVFWHTSTDDHHDLHERIFDRFEKIYCVSEGAKEVIAGCYSRYGYKFDVLENYIDYNSIIEKSTEYEPEFPEDKLILCSCGRMTAVKGFDLAVKAAQILRDNGVDFVWYFVGDGPERINIEKMIAERGLQERIVITGLLNNPYPYIKVCDIYVQPSYEEAHPLSLIEAQILCRPIVATATVGGKSVVKDGETGSLSEIEPKSLAEKINNLVNDEPLREKYFENLKKNNYESDRIRFCRQWKILLGDEL